MGESQYLCNRILYSSTGKSAHFPEKWLRVRLVSRDVVLNNVRFTRVQRAVNTINLCPRFHMYALTTGSVRGLGMVPIHGKILRLPSEKIEISGEMTFERNTSMSAPLDSGRKTLRKRGKRRQNR